MASPAILVGPDRVRYRNDDAVVIDSPVENPGWEFRDHRKIAVLFRGGRYFVSEKMLRPGGAYRYVLRRWPDDLTDLPGLTVEYDEQYVAERDARRRREARNDRVSAALGFVSAFLGFLPASVKRTLDERYAFDPVTVTKQSIFLEYVLVRALGALLVIDVFVKIRGASLLGSFLVPALGLEVALALDLVMRWGHAEIDAVDQPGFWEWAFRRFRRF